MKLEAMVDIDAKAALQLRPLALNRLELSASLTDTFFGDAGFTLANTSAKDGRPIPMVIDLTADGPNSWHLSGGPIGLTKPLLWRSPEPWPISL